jgi:aminopeptidase
MTTLHDPRVERYASLLLDTCIRVQPGWQVLVAGSFHARPLLEELARQLGRREAYVLLRVGLAGGGISPDLAWAREAPLAMLEHPSAIELDVLQRADALVVVEAPENTRQLTALDSERLQTAQRGIRPALERVFRDEVPWVGCQWPTPALAQEAGMSTDEFSDFLFGACLLDWAAEGERMRRQAARFDAAEQVRIVGEGTDLTLSLAGRTVEVDAGGANMPGGEFFGSPVEDSAEGVITFSEFPAVYAGREHQGIRLRFEGGRVVEASAETNEAHLLETLDFDEGARRLGELGIGCNPGITRYLRNTLFDEKIDGTVHVALGNGFPKLGGTNVSQVHWDLVKDLRQGGRIELDGVVVQENGVWLGV